MLYYHPCSSTRPIAIKKSTCDDGSIMILFSSLLAAAITYSALLQNSSKGDYKAGEIEIVTNPVEIAQIEELQKNRLLKNYTLEEAVSFSRVGIFAEDQYILGVRDAVIFPTGAKGTYDRLIWKNGLSGPPGVAVLPIYPDGGIALNLNYRHATRSWELELPRGLKKEGETLEAAALRELQEETGLEVEKPIYLGAMTPDSGILSSVVPIFMGKVTKAGLSDQEFSEAIEGIYIFTQDEIKKGLKQGYLEIKGKGKVPLRDPFLTYALVVMD